MTAAVMDRGDAITHPATFSRAILAALDTAIPLDAKVLDPFAGVGTIHELRNLWGRETFGVELEPEWAAMHPDTIHGDATALPFADDSFDAVATSPAYGNRMADSYDGRDGSTRYTYRCSLGRPLADGSGAALHWGDQYRQLHARAVAEMVRVTRPGGAVIINMKDHIRNGEQQPVCAWWIDTLGAATGAPVISFDIGVGGIGHQKHPSDLPERLITSEVTA